MPTPNFHDAPDGLSSINHTGEAFWTEISMDGDELTFTPQPAPIRPAPPSPNPVGYSRDFLPPCSPQRDNAPAPYPPYPETGAHTSRRSPRRARRGPSDPDAAMRKDPNAWSLREAVELCKLLEVVVPEAGFHIALTGGLLYKEGRCKDCDLMFYQIRQVDPNYEILWKYLQVAGVIRSPSYPENGWLVKATYRGKAVDCLFPNAKKAKKAGAAKDDCYKATPPAPPNSLVDASNPEGIPLTAAGTVLWSREDLDAVGRAIGQQGPVSVRHNDGAPILYRRSPSAPGSYDPAELLATPSPAPIPQYPPVNLENGVTVRYDPATRSFRTERQAEAAIDAAAEAQDDIPF